MMRAKKPLSEKTKILLVEDDPGHQELVAFNLEGEGWVIQQAADGEEALAMAKEMRPDLIALGWNLKKICGLDVCYSLKTRRDFGTVPVIMSYTLDEHLDQLCSIEQPVVWKFC